MLKREYQSLARHARPEGFSFGNAGLLCWATSVPDYQIKNKLANLILFFKVRLNQQFLTRYQTWTFLFWSLLKTRSPIPIPGSLDNPSSKTKTKKFPDGDVDVDVDLVRSCSSKSRLEMESIEGKRHHNYGILQPPTPQSSSSSSSFFNISTKPTISIVGFGPLFSNYITCCLVAEMVLF